MCSLVLLSGVVNIEIDNSLKWLPFNIMSGQTRSEALWK